MSLHTLASLELCYSRFLVVATPDKRTAILSQICSTISKDVFFAITSTIVYPQVVNEVVIDRGPSPYLCHIDLYVDTRHITSVQVSYYARSAYTHECALRIFPLLTEHFEASGIT